MPLRALGLAIVILSGCRIDPSAGPPFTGSDDADDPGATPPPDERTGGGGTNATSGGGSTNTPPSTGGFGGAGDEPPVGACDAQSVSLDELRSGAVLAGISAALETTATSQKFLLSKSAAGSCLWGAFVGGEPAAGEPRGLLVVSYGDPAPGDAPCAPGTDAIPDELLAGDSVRVVGRASSFAPSSCDATVAAPQLIADARCPFERLGRTTPPEPVPLSLDVADALARGSDPELVTRFAGGLVRLENVSALPNHAGDGAVRPYGVVALAETELEVHADIEYGDLGAGGPRDPSKGLDFGYPTTFASITGLVYLDYCSYALAPRSRCQDFEPPSSGCR